MRQYELCHRRCGLQTGNCITPKPCTACASTISADVYNEKISAALRSFQDNNRSYVIKQPGRYVGEYAVVLVEAGRYLGYGYVPDDVAVTSLDELKPFVNGHADNQDIQKILSMYKRSTNMLEIG